MVEPASQGLSKGLQKSSSKNNLAAMAEKSYSGSAGLLNKASPKKEGSAPTLLKRSRSMGTFGHYVNFGQQAVEGISGKISIGSPAPAPQAAQQAQAVATASATVSAAPTPAPVPAHAPAAPVADSSLSAAAPASPPSAAAAAPEDTPELVDDNNLHHMPMARVDYFSHEWSESDLAGSWRYIVSRRQDMANSARLENASWRTWAKAKYNLKTVRPETVNWLKDYDVTWLYGPLYHERSSTDWDKSEAAAQTAETLPKPDKPGKRADSIKSILKTKTIAEIMLEDSPDYQGPTDNYLRHHNYRHVTDDQQNIAKVVNAQYTKQKPLEPEDRHVHFNVRVEQCISLDPEEQPHPDQHIEPDQHHDLESDSEDSESEEGGLFLGIQRSSGTNLSTSRTIAPLPATTLNTPEDEEQELSQTKGSRNYDYNSVYTCKTPAFKIVDPKVHPVEIPDNVATAISSNSTSTESSSSPARQANASFGFEK